MEKKIKSDILIEKEDIDVKEKKPLVSKDEIKKKADSLKSKKEPSKKEETVKGKACEACKITFNSIACKSCVNYEKIKGAN